VSTATGRALHVVLPGDVDDPASPSGGNVYDRHLCRELEALGWLVHATPVAGSWPRPDPDARDRLARVLAAVPDGAVVLLDGLVACGVPDVVVPAARRLRLAVLVHLPLADETGLEPALAAELDSRERETLCAAAAVVVTSRWAGLRLAGSAPDRVHVAAPGVHPAPLAPGTDGASRLLCVAAVTPRKAHDVLVRALVPLIDRPWTCVLAGPLDRDPGHVRRLREQIDRAGVRDRVLLVGPLAGQDLDAAYRAADLAVVVSWTETYGMAVTEALARGVPVLVSDGGALPDTLGRAPDGTRPGLVVPAGDVEALTAALSRWFDQPALRAGLQRSAHGRRAILTGWDETGRHLHAVLQRLLPR